MRIPVTDNSGIRAFNLKSADMYNGTHVNGIGNPLNRSVRQNTDVITAEVLEALRNGDHKAYERIYIKYSHKVMVFINSLVRSYDEAEELTQDVFVNLWVKRQNVDPCNNFNGYIYRLARNGVLKHFRSKNIHSAYLNNAPEAEASEFGSDDILYATEIQLLVDLAVSRMPRQRRTVYEMSRVKGLSNEEIAGRLNITRNAVEKHISFALKDIREVIGIFVALLMMR